MKLAVDEMNEKDAADLQALFEEVRALDAAIERSATGDIRPGDVLYLRRNGFVGDEAIRLEYENRVKPIRIRAVQAGSHKEFAAAQKRVEDADKSAEQATVRLTPKIEEAREKLRKLESELRSFEDEKKLSRIDLDRMATARDLLTDKLLPPMLRTLHGVIQKRAYANFHPRIQSIRHDMGRPDISGSQRDELQREFAAVEAEVKAATPVLDVYILPDAK